MPLLSESARIETSPVYRVSRWGATAGASIKSRSEEATWNKQAWGSSKLLCDLYGGLLPLRLR